MKLVLAQTEKEVVLIEVSSLTVVGGKTSSGRQLKSLKQPGDYAVLSLGASGEVVVHSMLGSNRGVRELRDLEMNTISDLKLLSLDGSVFKPSKSEANISNSETLSHVLPDVIRAFSAPDDLAGALSKTLEILLSRYLFEKGLVVVKKLSGEFEALVSQGLRHGDPWLSESLIQDTLKSQSPITVRNIIGSQYDTKRSLIASGFMSVCAWPLVVRGKVVGALIIGSTKPHQGLSDRDLNDAQSIVALTGLIVQYHLRELKTREEISALRAIGGKKESPFLSQNPKMLESIRLGAQVAGSDLSILIQGETGVGKEVMARFIHDRSERSGRPFVAINCGAIPADLLESVLFGHKKGAFTGAVNDMMGKFQAADGGTLFLDEIGDLPKALQVKILRALQERAIEPVGSPRAVQVDVRVISATHRPIARMVTSNEFREDLFYRLAEVTIELPALRDRREDIPVLATEFLKEYASEKRFSVTAWEWLKLQSWKGNVRELRSSVKRVAVLAPSEEITVEDFTRGLPKNEAAMISNEKVWLGGETLEEARDLFTARKVREALILASGKRTRAAELLGVTPRTLFRYLDQFGPSLQDVLSGPDADRSVTVN